MTIYAGDGGAVIQLGARQIASEIRDGVLSAVEVVDANIARIEQVDPMLNAVVIPTFDDAR